MPIFIYNSLSRKKEEFVPVEPQKVKMYVCGPTVYDEPHIGHARSAYIFDLIRRYLDFRGYRVEFVRNVTDVDDKIINKARDEFPGEELNSSFRKVSEKYLASYHRALESLGIDGSGIKEPRASEYISRMLDFIGGLIAKGAAYVSEGDVYFDIKKAGDYGKLSHQALEKMEAGSRISPGEKKRDPLDFALWKSAKPEEPSWESPWGRGRPGWHIECSVMSSDILGDEFDIHGGGIDLIFPHHENEIAQSEGAGKKFARYWIHHGLLTIDGQKMSKSLGNFITVENCLNKHSADALKVLFLSTHYSHPVDYTEQKIADAEKEIQRIEILFHRIEKIKKSQITGEIGLVDFITAGKEKFMQEMDDDFNTPGAIAAVFELVNKANKFFDTQGDNVKVANAVKSALVELFSILGINLDNKNELSDEDVDYINLKVRERNESRKNRDFRRSDEIRKELESKGIILEDTKDGTSWRKKI